MHITRKALEGVCVAICVIIFFGIVFLAAGGGMAIFAGPNKCTGIRDIRVGNASTYWEIAEREFPNDDPRVVTAKMLEMNEGYSALHRSTIKAPVEC
jgi:hypothetical protein